MKKKLPKEKAGVVAYRIQANDEPLVLVVSARKYENQWVFPVGSVKPGESLEAAAKRECEEESGYLVEVGDRLPSVEIPGNGKPKRFTFFLSTVVGQVDQWETDRRRKWLPASKVVAALPDVFQGLARRAVERILR
jgi:8-oxo-dGTP pyrophosphatase MutT (NUDIX family)